MGLAVDGSNNLYVAVSADNRVLVFPTANGSAMASAVLGQPDYTTTAPNSGAFPFASPNTLSAPVDVKVDRSGNVVIADTGNNRVLEFPPNSKSSIRVWGQTDFTSNGQNEIKPTSVDLPLQRWQSTTHRRRSPFMSRTRQTTGCWCGRTRRIFRMAILRTWLLDNRTCGRERRTSTHREAFLPECRCLLPKA